MKRSNTGDVKSVQKKPDLSETESDIFFNSLIRNKYTKLSNFYGGVEFRYQAYKFKEDSFLYKWLQRYATDEFEGEDGAKRFLSLLKLIQPDKKTWTIRQEQYWFHAGDPIPGILAKLVGNIANQEDYKLPVLRRLNALLASENQEQVNGGQSTWNSFRAANVEDRAAPETMKLQMRLALRAKYEIPLYRELLKGTGEKALHELENRGHENAWTTNYTKEKGQDWLGQLLMEVRTTVSPPTPS
jgi:hypothetical protein